MLPRQGRDFARKCIYVAANALLFPSFLYASSLKEIAISDYMRMRDDTGRRSVPTVYIIDAGDEDANNLVAVFARAAKDVRIKDKPFEFYVIRGRIDVVEHTERGHNDRGFVDRAKHFWPNVTASGAFVRLNGDTERIECTPQPSDEVAADFAGRLLIIYGQHTEPEKHAARFSFGDCSGMKLKNKASWRPESNRVTPLCRRVHSRSATPAQDKIAEGNL